jgi:hypothetical protein
MAVAVPLRCDFDAAQLRALAKRSRDPDQTRRLLWRRSTAASHLIANARGRIDLNQSARPLLLPRWALANTALPGKT